jgi:hypothetical protein
MASKKSSGLAHPSYLSGLVKSATTSYRIALETADVKKARKYLSISRYGYQRAILFVNRAMRRAGGKA